MRGSDMKERKEAQGRGAGTERETRAEVVR